MASLDWGFVGIHLGLVYVCPALQNNFEGLFGNSNLGESSLQTLDGATIHLLERENYLGRAGRGDRATPKSPHLKVTDVPVVPFYPSLCHPWETVC